LQLGGDVNVVECGCLGTCCQTCAGVCHAQPCSERCCRSTKDDVAVVPRRWLWQWSQHPSLT
jgi:hypothetical protein